MESFIYPLNIIGWFSVYLLYHKGATCPDYHEINEAELLQHFPFLASIQYDGIHIGTGSILSKTHILTTKKYFDGLEANKLKVVVGICNIDSKRHPKYHSVSKAIVHPKYKGLRYSFDVAILILYNPLVFGETTKPIKKLWDAFDVPKRPRFILVGWGTEKMLMDARNYSRVLHRKSVCVLETGDECLDVYPYLFQKDSMICGKVLAVGKDTDGLCLSDWGSPILHHNGKEMVLLGLASYQDNKFRCQLNKPVIFTSIYKVIDFIATTTKSISFTIADNIPRLNNTKVNDTLKEHKISKNNRKNITKFAEKIADELCDSE